MKFLCRRVFKDLKTIYGEPASSEFECRSPFCSVSVCSLYGKCSCCAFSSECSSFKAGEDCSTEEFFTDCTVGFTLEDECRSPFCTLSGCSLAGKCSFRAFSSECIMFRSEDEFPFWKKLETFIIVWYNNDILWENFSSCTKLTFSINFDRSTIGTVFFVLVLITLALMHDCYLFSRSESALSSFKAVYLFAQYQPFSSTPNVLSFKKWFVSL